MWWLILITVISMIISLRWRWKMRHILELSKKLPCGLKHYPLIGLAYLFLGNSIDYMNGIKVIGNQCLKFGGLCSVWLGPKCYVVAADPVDLEVILKTAVEKDDIYHILRVITGNGSIFAPATIGRARRKIVAPLFNLKNLNDFQEIFSRESTVMIEQMAPVVGKGPVSIWQYVTAYTLDAICESVMNVKLNMQQQSDTVFIKSLERILQYATHRMVSPWLHPDAVYKLLPHYYRTMKQKTNLDNFINEQITKCKRNMMENNETSKNRIKCFLELMINSSAKVGVCTDLELHEEALVLTTAANDTSAVAICFVISMLASYPDVQDKVVRELQEVFGDTMRPVTTKDLLRLKYLEVVVKETLRLYPPVPVIIRKVEEDFELPSGVTLVEGCGVLVNIWATHRNPKYWGDDAELFRPERFLETPCKHPLAFLPFSYGQRNCIGFQYAMISIKSNLATFLRNYRVLRADDEINYTNMEPKPLTVSFDITTKDVDKCRVKLEKRTKHE